MSTRDPRPGDWPPAAPRPAHDWRSDTIGMSGLNVLAGIWLIIAPWVLGYSRRDPRWNDVVFGAIVGIIALIRISGAYREEWLSWLNALIAVWIFVAAFTVDHTATASWNDVILGVIVFILALASADATAEMFGRNRSAPPGRRAAPPAGI